jgi:amino acid permease
VKTLISVTKVIFDVDVDPWIFIIITLLIHAPLSWIRQIERFQDFYVFAVFSILGMIILVVVFESMLLSEHDNEAGPGWTAFNEDKYFIMICLAFYMFEGIGSVLPVMEASDAKDNFNVLLVSALATLCCVHIVFSELSYYVYGNDLNEPILILKLPADNWVVVVAKILFCVNLLISYPLVIYVTNNVIE